jgi:curli production assembly/transport component CsgF
MIHLFFTRTILTLTTALVILATAGELTYTPTNPSFGGNASNAQWLMNSAQIQNNYTDEEKEDAYKLDPLQEFKNNLNRQILNKFSTEIVQAAFGEGTDDLKEGHYQIGDYAIDVNPMNNDIRVIITDNLTGNQTIIEVPYYDSTIK